MLCLSAYSPGPGQSLVRIHIAWGHVKVVLLTIQHHWLCRYVSLRLLHSLFFTMSTSFTSSEGVDIGIAGIKCGPAFVHGTAHCRIQRGCF